MSDIDLIRDALEQLRSEIRQASVALAQYVKQYGDDATAYALADKIMAGVTLERRYRKMLVNEEILA